MKRGSRTSVLNGASIILLARINKILNNCLVLSSSYPFQTATFIVLFRPNIRLENESHLKSGIRFEKRRFL